MSRSHIPRALRQRVSEQADHRCGYCLTSEQVVGARMELDHLIPEALGGQTVEENLWLACPSCNLYKGIQTAALDSEGGVMVRLFNPRTDSWRAHFAWQDGGTRIIGLTAVGRATVEALRLNRAILVAARQLWVACGLHPP